MNTLPGGRLLFLDPRGGPHYDGRWALPRLPEPHRFHPVRELMRENLRILRGASLRSTGVEGTG
jgi:hypothetical protein